MFGGQPSSMICGSLVVKLARPVGVPLV